MDESNQNEKIADETLRERLGEDFPIFSQLTSQLEESMAIIHDEQFMEMFQKHMNETFHNNEYAPLLEYLSFMKNGVH